MDKRTCQANQPLKETTLDYNQIFGSNVVRLLEEMEITKQEFSALAGVSGGFLTELARGSANPTLRTMQTIAEALGVPLPLLLKPLNSDEWQAIIALSQRKPNELKKEEAPEGYGYVEHVLLPLHKVYVISEWEKEAKKSLRQRKKGFVPKQTSQHT